ncbi:MAG TPA: HlyD family secretion protein [Bacteroidales bacterium]|nr:HlyD family secretion protein [Bacteroidales bacterium]
MSDKLPDTSPDQGIPEESSNQKKDLKEGRRSPVRIITIIVLAISALFFIWYVLSDRHVPYTNQSRINGLMIPIVPRVSGNLTGIHVRLHTKVSIGDTLFQIDKRPFILAVEQAEANLENTAQGVSAKTASVKSAAGRLGMARAQLDRAQRDWNRVEKVIAENPGALSHADRDQSETALSQATEQVASAEADLERAEQALGISGETNPQYRMAVKALEQAQLDLAYTTITASANGHIESFSIDLGYYASTGQPLATLVSTNDLWIQANMKENNISLMKPGDQAEFALDVIPGRIFTGEVRSIGYGVSTGNTNRGDLPTVSGAKGWLKDPQRFPVIITINEKEIPDQLRFGGQVDVVVFTNDKKGVLNALGKLRIRIISWLSYVR